MSNKSNNYSQNVPVKKRNVKFNGQTDANEIDQENSERRPLIFASSIVNHDMVDD